MYPKVSKAKVQFSELQKKKRHENYNAPNVSVLPISAKCTWSRPTKTNIYCILQLLIALVS